MHSLWLSLLDNLRQGQDSQATTDAAAGRQRFVLGLRGWLAVVTGVCFTGCSDDSTQTSDTAGATSADTASSTDDSTDTLQTGWRESLTTGTDIGMFMSVWGPAPNDVWAVGGQDYGDGVSEGIVFRTVDGATWSSESVPDGTLWLNWVFGVADELWTVGRGGTILRRTDDAWTAIGSPLPVVLWGGWGATTDDVWLVGGDGVSDAPALLHYDGESVETVTLPEYPNSESTFGLFKVWGRSASEVYAVGDAGLALRYDGQSWSVLSNDSVSDLVSLWGTSDQLLIVGGRANGRLARIESDAVVGETAFDPGLSGVWMDTLGRATVVGSFGTIGEVRPGEVTLSPMESPTNLLLHAVFGFEDGTMFAVGGSFLQPPPHVGIILQYVP